MRKIAWISLVVIIFVWLAISAYWTGHNGKPKQKLFPTDELTPTLAAPDLTITPVPVSTSSATPSATPSEKPSPTSLIKAVSPTVSVEYRY